MGRRRAPKKKASAALVEVPTTGSSSSSVGERQTRAQARAVRRLTSSTTVTSSSVPTTTSSATPGPSSMSGSTSSGRQQVPIPSVTVPPPVDTSQASGHQLNTGERIVDNIACSNVQNVHDPIVSSIHNVGNSVDVHVSNISSSTFMSAAHVSGGSALIGNGMPSGSSMVTCADSLMLGRPLSGISSSDINSTMPIIGGDNLINTHHSHSHRPIPSTSIHQVSTLINGEGSFAPLISQPGQSTLSTMAGRPLQMNSVSALGHTLPFQGLGVIPAASGVANSTLGLNSSVINSSSSSTVSSAMFNDSPFQLTSVCEPLASNVSQSMRTKIVNSEYVDFAQLLDFQEKTSEEPRDMKLVVDESGTFVWKPNKPKNQITSIFGWTSAFFIFSSIYLQAHPHRAQELLKYAQIVRMAASRFGVFSQNRLGWYSYDKQWRLRQACHPQRSWGVLDSELWSMYVSTPTDNRAFQPRDLASAPWRENAVLQNLCFNFNRSECSRKNCPFKHKCARCQDGGHGAGKCEKATDLTFAKTEDTIHSFL